MKVSELITELQKFPTDTEVCITDWRKHNKHKEDLKQINITLDSFF